MRLRPPRLVPAAALALLAVALVPAAGAARPPAIAYDDPGQTAAARACAAYSAYGPATVKASVADGTGDWFVWVADRAGDLWLCNANAAGEIFMFVPMAGDLLDGAGSDYLALNIVGGSSGPARRAENVCAAVLPPADGAMVLASLEDGLGDWFVWLGTPAGEYYLCNATVDGMLYAFVAVGGPIHRPPADPPATA